MPPRRITTTRRGSFGDAVPPIDSVAQELVATAVLAARAPRNQARRESVVFISASLRPGVD
jgi:hypothetical protein